MNKLWIKCACDNVISHKIILSVWRVGVGLTYTDRSYLLIYVCFQYPVLLMTGSIFRVLYTCILDWF
jgi:hypothetical protein